MKKPLLTGYWFRDLQSLIMASISLLLLVSFLCITIHGCFGGYTPTVNTTFSPTAPRLPCEYVAIGKCNHEFKNVFLIANRRAIYAGRAQSFKDKKNVYCQALQVLIKLYWVSTLFNTVVKFSPSFFFEQFFPISRHGKVNRLPWVFMGEGIFQTVYHALWLPSSQWFWSKAKQNCTSVKLRRSVVIFVFFYPWYNNTWTLDTNTHFHPWRYSSRVLRVANRRDTV